MHRIYINRTTAGRILAGALEDYAHRDGLIILALPRGGVPVAAEVAHALQVPLDVLVVRKLGAPFNPEFALGAVASGGFRVLNQRAIDAFHVSPVTIAGLTTREERELHRREQMYRHGHGAPDWRGRPVIVIDDGVATGSTMRVAVEALREVRAGPIIVATPVAARESYLELRSRVHGFVALELPRDFGSVGQYYGEFEQFTDAQVRQLLDHARKECAALAVG